MSVHRFFLTATINKVIAAIDTIDKEDKYRVGVFYLREIHRENGHDGLSESYVKFDFLGNEFKISGQGLGFYDYKGKNEEDIFEVETTLKVEIIKLSTRVRILEMIYEALKDFPEATMDFTLTNYFYRDEYIADQELYKNS